MNDPIRPCVIVGNWKMHKTLEDAHLFVKGLRSFLISTTNQIGLAVPFTAIYPLAEECKNEHLMIGAQNMNDASEGAFTGEIAGFMLVEAGAKFVLLGHSERRNLYQEDDHFINNKIKKAVTVGLVPILCIGETKEEYENKQTHQVIERQLREGLKNLSAEQLNQLIIAYEPVWAIGHGHSAIPQDVQLIHGFCREILAQIFTQEFAHQTVIQYGGSVNPENARSFLAEKDIDGLLIGGASLSLEFFTQIVNDKYSKISVNE
jgi:triosephosphate isomerase